MSGETLTPAIVLRTHAAREADLIVVLLTAARGRVECHARGARKSRRRFPGGLPTGARGEATIGPLRRGSLPRRSMGGRAKDVTSPSGAW